MSQTNTVEKTGSLLATIEKSLGGMNFVLSSSKPDRVSDTIDPAAYDTVGSKVIALWQHSHDKPIGYWDGIKRVTNKLVGTLNLAGTDLAKMVKELLDADVPLGASIGFRGKGKFNDLGGIHFSTLELLEASVVSVPMHPEAMRIAKSFGMSLDPATSGRSSIALLRARAAIESANLIMGKSK